MKIFVRIHRGGGGGGETVQRVEPPKYVRPYYEDILDIGQELSRQPREQFPFSTVVPYSPETEAALTGITERALSGSPLTQAAQQQQLATIGGQYLDPMTNPAYQAVQESVAADIIPEAYTSYASGGQFFGSPVETEAVSRGLARGLAPFAFGDYGRERGLQQQASQFAPTLAETDYRDLQALAGVGAAREDLAGRELDEAIQRFQFPQEEQRIRLGDYAGLVFGTPVAFNQTGQQRAQRGNPIFGALGGGLGGAALGSQLLPGAGTLAGALLGGVGGLFG